MQYDVSVCLRGEETYFKKWGILYSTFCNIFSQKFSLSKSSCVIPFFHEITWIISNIIVFPIPIPLYYFSSSPMEPGYVYTILGADVSYFLCCTTSATKEIGDDCMQANSFCICTKTISDIYSFCSHTRTVISAGFLKRRETAPSRTLKWSVTYLHSYNSKNGVKILGTG